MSSSNCCFLTCIQISQEAGQEVWYSHLLKNFPQFVVIYTVKDFGTVNEAKVDVFLKFSCFFYDPTDVGNLISRDQDFALQRQSEKLPFLNPVWTSGSARFMYCWSLAWRIWSITLLVRWVQLCGSLNILWHRLSLGLEFRIWNSSAGIPSPPLALSIVMLPKAHLTSHSRMSGC